MSEIELDIAFHVKSMDEAEKLLLSKRFEHAAQWVADHFNLDRLTASISVVDDATIHRLNRQHLQHDWPTDVISFVFDAGPTVNGEVIASWDTAQRLSVAAQWPPHDELLLYVVHGLLHLAGMDDRDPSGQAAMRAVEQEYLAAAKIPGAELYLDRFNDVSY